MAYTIVENFVKEDKYSIKCPYTMEAEYITVHNTYNDASAAAEVAYMISNTNQVSFHIGVDDVEAVFGIPLNRNAWHAGDGASGTGNRKSIGVEICYSKSGGEKYVAAEENAVQLIAALLKERGWGIDRVKKHQDWSGKYCPHRILDEGRWNEFLARVEAALKGVEYIKVPEPTKPVGPNLTVDGSWGPATTKALQKHYGTTVDGVISGQPKNASTVNIPSVQFGTGGSQLIRAMQKDLGTTVDGVISSPSQMIKALQKRFGTIQDGVVSNPSLVVKAMQKALNEGTF